MKRKYFDEYGCSSRLYNSWKHMKERCYNPKCHDYCHWGGRGITVCEAWRDEFLAFKEWALANGYKDGLTIDRIDNNGNYEPSNCRWATKKEQSNNRRSLHHLTYNGATKTITEWSRETGLNITTILMRLNKYKWSVEDTLKTPSMKRGENRASKRQNSRC
jgi:hypothetical protein